MEYRKLVEVTTLISRGVSPSYADSGTAVINQRCIRDGRLSLREIRYQSVLKAPRTEKYLVPDDILVNSTGVGTLGRAAQFSEESGEFIADSHVTIVRPHQGEIDSIFLFYVIRLLETQIIELSTGSTGQTELSKLALQELLIPVPDRRLQGCIATLMKSLDDRIELNRSTASTVESIAQTLFRSWFVDFDPVRAKMAGEKPAGMDDATAELFPDSMEESELGEIPAGWKVGDLGELCHLTMGQSPPGDAYNLSGEGLPFYQGRTDFGMRFPKTRMYSTLGNRKASPGDVLVSVRAPVGDLNQALEECVIGRGVAAVIHRSGSQAYSYSLMQSIQHRLEYFNGEGTVFGAINKTDFSSIPLVEPPVELLNRFDELASPVNGLLRSLHEQSQNLAATRDALLPRLISGELEVPEDLLVS